MKQTRHMLLRLGIASIAGASAFFITLAAAYWLMTDRLSLGLPLRQALAFSGIGIVYCLVGSLLLLLLLSIVRRYRRPDRWMSAALGGLLFWLVPAAWTRFPETSLLAVPSGLVTGLILGSPNIMRRNGLIALSAGIMLWLGLLAIPAQRAWEEHELAQQPVRPSLLGERIMGGVVFESELWLFNQVGMAASYRLADWRPTLRSQSGVAAFTVSGSTMWALMEQPLDREADHTPGGQFRLASYSAGRWHYGPPHSYPPDEQPIALTPVAEGLIVLGPKALYLANRDGKVVTTKALSQPIKPWGQFVAARAISDGDTLYLGINRGEWGGGLLRIKLSTGEVLPVERHDGQGLCSGPLNGECDPVTGLVPDAKRPDCVFASIGIAHMMWSGRVLRVCGSRVEIVFEAQILPLGERIQRAFSSDARRFPPQSEPVFSLTPAAGGFWAVTPRALYRWDEGRIERKPFPSLDSAQGLPASKAIPGLVVVSTDANSAYSLSGITPLAFATAPQ